MSAQYVLADELPRTRLGSLAFHPSMLLIGGAIAGPWLLWPLVILNAFAMRSRPILATLLAVGASVFGTGAIAVALVTLDGMRYRISEALSVPAESIMWILPLSLWKILSISGLYHLQARSFTDHTEEDKPSTMVIVNITAGATLIAAACFILFLVSGDPALGQLGVLVGPLYFDISYPLR